MISVYHFQQTNIAGAPSELAKAINKFSTKYRCVVHNFKNRVIPRISADILHAHNTLPNNQRCAKTIIQYHSEPWQVNLVRPVDARLVIAQYHATLKEYATCKVVRNVIDFTTQHYVVKKQMEKIKIGFSPSRKSKIGQWHDKGYEQTVNVLQKIQKKYREKVELDIITGVSLEECIRRKSECSIIIDECVTASYHRSGLEGLALGKLTICSLSPQVEQVLLTASGAKSSPFHNVWISDLELELCKIIDAGPQYIYECGLNNRKWMEEYWHPQAIVNEFTKIYDSL